MAVFKSERDLIRRFLMPKLKEKGYVVKKSIKINQRIQKLISEEVVTEQEVEIEHPGQPDIDLVFWRPEEPPVIQAAEVKYFRFTKKGIQPKAFYDGLHEAEILLTYGFDYVYLWHFFDQDLPRNLHEHGPKVINEIIENTYLPVNYQKWLIKIPSKPLDIKTLGNMITGVMTEILSFNVYGIYPYAEDLRRNSLIGLKNVKKRRKILRKALRIV